MNKRIVILLVLVMAGVGMVFASGQGEGEAADGTPTFSYMIPNPYFQWLMDQEWYPAMKESAGVEIDLINGGSRGEYYQQVDLQIASGGLPDLFMLNLAQQTIYGGEGALVDWAPLIDEYAPNIQAFIDENPTYAALISTGENIYGIGAEYPRISAVTLYRADLFEQAGIDEMPETIDEFTDDLRTLRDEFSDVDNFYPFQGRGSFIEFRSVFGANDYIDENGTVHGRYEGGSGYDINSQGFRDLVEWLKLLYDEDLIDPEWVAGIQTEETWQTKMLTGKGAVSDDFFTRPAWFMANADLEEYPTYQIDVMPLFKDENGNQLKRPSTTRFPNDRYVAINAETSDAMRETIVRFHDFLFTDVGINYVALGVEGESYEMVDGEPSFLIDWEEQAAIPMGTPHWFIAQDRFTFAMPVDNELYYQYQSPLVKSFAEDYFSNYVESYPQLKYTTDQLRRRSDLTGQVVPAVEAGVVEFVNGSRPMSEWQDFLDEMNELGFTEIEEIDQAAYDATY